MSVVFSGAAPRSGRHVAAPEPPESATLEGIEWEPPSRLATEAEAVVPAREGSVSMRPARESAILAVVHRVLPRQRMRTTYRRRDVTPGGERD